MKGWSHLFWSNTVKGSDKTKTAAFSLLHLGFLEQNCKCRTIRNNRLVQRRSSKNKIRLQYSFLLFWFDCILWSLNLQSPFIRGSDSCESGAVMSDHYHSQQISRKRASNNQRNDHSWHITAADFHFRLGIFESLMFPPFEVLMKLQFIRKK